MDKPLSPSQRRALLRIAAAVANPDRWVGTIPTATDEEPWVWNSIAGNTVPSLVRAGLVDLIRETVGLKRVRLTRAGRAALAALPREDG